ncbi:unnamed protein product [Penicillium salamii]|uniref:Uncharacterized protein n=1 Tax=Penicillium salamii TaxID=1612424 RepID=A0A9W4K062_9EURO|nr:unnamed protein product [Penicillium salamii]CAG7938615.1 unnamed protein product [Penicillium salamii]CAG7951213.1 unnamed protein product [Penicillium salamii]CAG8225948.1 unnamed protein product [Penicillium salamii]CAG8259064.1 unnamed protein product [Penicillium salamii]
MDQQLLSFVKYFDQNREPDTPQLTLRIEGEPTVDVWVDEPSYSVLFTITRSAEDPQTKPCIIYWDPTEDGFSPSGSMLILHTLHGLRPVVTDPEKLPTRNLIPQKVTPSDPHFKELVPGSSVSWRSSLPAVYLEDCPPAASYSILWPGGKIHPWDWGTLAEHCGQTLALRSLPIVVPGPSYHTYEILNYESDPEYFEDPPPPSPRAISPSSRVNGAPIFNVSISGPATLSMKDRTPSMSLYPLTVTVTYDAVAGLALCGRPLTFHSFVFKRPDNHHEGFRLYRRTNDAWTPYEWRTHQGGFIITEPYPLNVGRNDENHFWSLNPGESWSFTREVIAFPKDAAPGDQYRYLFKGATIDWWDWGSFKDHENTVVWVPGWLEAKVEDPKDNGGRPVIIVPASNAVEFTLTD